MRLAAYPNYDQGNIRLPSNEHKTPSVDKYGLETLTNEEVTEALQKLFEEYKKDGARELSRGRPAILNEAQLHAGKLEDMFADRSIWRRYKTGPNAKGDATARIIRADEHGARSLQLHVDELPMEWQYFLDAIPATEIGEFGSLRSDSEGGPLAVNSLILGLREVSLHEGIRYWTGGLRPLTFKLLKRTYGDALQQIGETVHLGTLASEFVPFFVDLEKGFEVITSTQQQLGKRTLGTFLKSGTGQKHSA